MKNDDIKNTILGLEVLGIPKKIKDLENRKFPISNPGISKSTVQGMLGDYPTQSAADASYVPYTGASSDVDLGINNIVTTGTLGVASETITAPPETFVTPLSVPEVVSTIELVTNGSLASDDSGWTVGAGWSWSATGEVHATGSGLNSFSQNITVVAGAWYRVSITTSGITLGSLQVTLGGRKVFYGLTGNTTNTTTVRATNTTGLFITPVYTSFDGTVDNISVKRVSPGFGNFGTGFSAGTASPTSFVHITGATNGDEGVGDGAGSLVYINQQAGWNAACPYSLFVTGYSNIGGFRINSADGIRALFGTVSGRQLGFAANDGIITFTNGVSGNTTRMTIEKNGTITLGAGVAGLDQILAFNGETNDGAITWMEDENGFKFGNNVGIGINPTSLLTLAAGTATAGTAPLKFTSGTLNTTPEIGSVEFLTDDFFATITTSAVRKTIAWTPTQTNVTGSRALNTTYTNTGTRSIMVTATVRCAVTLAGGNAYVQGMSDTATPSVTIATGLVGIQAGLLGEDNSFQISFIVAAGKTYQITPSATNGTCTLGVWFETNY